MAEALAAFGLASNIVQFVDFGIKLVSCGSELYSSAEGASKENTIMEKITLDIKRNTQNLVSGGVNHDEALRDLVKACNELARDRLAVLGTLKIDVKKNRRMETIRKSLKNFQKRREIKDIYNRLCIVRDQICSHLNFLLNNHLTSLLPTMNGFSDTTNALTSEMMNKLEAISSQIEVLVNEKPWKTGDSDSLSTLNASLLNLVNQVKSTRKVHGFLKSLHFKQIKERQFEVKTAHAKTFEWIFKNESLNFMQWLRSPYDIFWIGGKAGSGKSTFMKFLCEDRRTGTLLSEWAGQQKIIIASHIFWSAGTPIQKSQGGLLRALLFQIIVHAPDLIPLVCPARWSDDSLVSHYDLEPLGHSELFQAFENMAKIDELPAKFCLFIDGLDEYDGDHADIIRNIKNLAQSPHIKLCVSSRPWTVFVDAFDRLQWKLYVQDLTRADIRLYIKDNLEEDPRFRELKEREAIGSERLFQQIIEKAQGVFLWVYLVVRSLLRGLTNSDDMSDLELRLSKLPGHLESYFKHMLNTIEDVYQQQTARTFRIMLCASSSLPLIALHFIDQERQDPNYALRRETRLVSVQELMEIVVLKTRQLNARCKDLLEVTLDPREHLLFRYKVGFLHRTVVDFLHTGDVADLMSSLAGSDFNPDACLCRAYLAQVKALPVDFDYTLKPALLHYLIFGTMQHAKGVETTRESAKVEVLDELDRTITGISRGISLSKRYCSRYPLEVPD